MSRRSEVAEVSKVPVTGGPGRVGQEVLSRQQRHEGYEQVPYFRTARASAGPPGRRPDAGLWRARPFLRTGHHRVPALPRGDRGGAAGRPRPAGPRCWMRDRAVLRPAAGQGRRAGRGRRHRGIARDGGGGARAHRGGGLAQRHGGAVARRGRGDRGRRRRRSLLRRPRHLAVPGRAAERHEQPAARGVGGRRRRQVGPAGHGGREHAGENAPRALRAELRGVRPALEPSRAADRGRPGP